MNIYKILDLYVKYFLRFANLEFKISKILLMDDHQFCHNIDSAKYTELNCSLF
jgi:hypothetical protein